MKRTSWLCWLLACLSALTLIHPSEAQYKYRRTQLPPPQIFKKSWGPGPRMPPMGNSIHIGFPPKRPLFKPPPNYRFRRPPVIPGAPPPPPPPPAPPMFNILPNSAGSFKKPLVPLGNILAGFPTLGPAPQSQRLPPPMKELQSLAKPLYSPEYRPPIKPATINLAVNHHRGSLDDDKGPIHTIPAPNLGPASKSYQQQKQQQAKAEQGEPMRRPYTVTQADYASIFGQETSAVPQRVLPSNPSPTTSFHQYEVTESNEVHSMPPAYFAPEFNSAQFASSILQDQQANDVYRSHPSTTSSRASQLLDQQQSDAAAAASSSVSMQTNLHSSMHVAGAGQQVQHEPGTLEHVHVGQPGSAGPPISAAKLYEVLNAFPHQLTEQYALNQGPQIQQHLLQQHISQMIQQQEKGQGTAIKPSFSQPALHSFNYDEQTNKQSQQQQQQNIFVDQNYASGKVSADYSLAPENPEISQDIHVGDGNEQQENNIEFESHVRHVKPATYFTKIGDDESVATQFYTTLPNRDAAEKLAALAAAGNVNSQLIGQLRKQQQQQQQADQPIMPSNHKEEDEEEMKSDYRPKLYYQRRHKVREEQQQQARREEEKQPVKDDGNGALRIFVPENNDDKEKEIASEDYEYENDDAELSREHEPSENAGFGSRIISKNN